VHVLFISFSVFACAQRKVTLITGFLGAGKSTLVAHVLSTAHGRRIAVVVNEFGAGLGLDKLLVQDGAPDRCERVFLFLSPRPLSVASA
jgi:hypothetical protein